MRKSKLRASTTRRSMAASDEMDYEEMSEPNMKLSRALLIVLVLHVVAVAGIIAFNTIKSRQGAFRPPKSSISSVKTDAAQPAPAKSEAVAMPPANDITQPPPRDDAQRATALAKPMTKEAGSPESTKIPKALPVGAENGNVYVVAAGDNPVKIAKKLKVSQEELLAVNHIDDPRKLQIGQKLIVPASKKPKSKAGNRF